MSLYRKKLIDVNLPKSAEGYLSGSPEVRTEIQEQLGTNIKATFAYLESGLQKYLPGDDFYDPTGDVRKLLDGSVSPGTPEWKEAMDGIVSSYLDEDAYGNLSPNQKAMDATLEEFGSGDLLYNDIVKERNSYTVLLQMLQAYEALRDLDEPTDKFDF